MLDTVLFHVSQPSKWKALCLTLCGCLSIPDLLILMDGDDLLWTPLNLIYKEFIEFAAHACMKSSMAVGQI